jgi:NAD(P)-dependent dehydrogenase (short-subunit alcohol dehydrogenase family)
MNVLPEELEICLKVLQQISENPAAISHHVSAAAPWEHRFKSLIAKIHKEGRKSSRRTARQHQQAEDRSLKETTLMVLSQRQQPSAAMPDASVRGFKTLTKSIRCYICKEPYTQVHFFYHLLCPKCAAFNYEKRHQRTDLTNRTALITGGRIKIGYQTALRMLRDGAKVIVTTRFPRDGARRYSREADFIEWRDRLHIYGLDLRNIPAVEAFVRHLNDTEPALDIIINNAAQTIKRPLAFYQHLLEQELQPLEVLPAEAQSLIPLGAFHHPFLLEEQPQYPAHLPAISKYFPPNTFDADGQQLDKRPTNSWLLQLDEISTMEMLEVQLVNAIAPFILNGQLKPLLMRSRSVSEGHSPFERRFIINVSAMEGQFNRDSKTPFHPHTNMAKAALNMMTRTSAQDYARNGIFMNSVDTGWITDENPYPKKTHLQEDRGFYTPLDAIDGMARIYDPIVQGIENPATPLYGHFLKDYAPYPW